MGHENISIGHWWCWPCRFLSPLVYRIVILGVCVVWVAKFAWKNDVNTVEVRRPKVAPNYWQNLTDDSQAGRQARIQAWCRHNHNGTAYTQKGSRGCIVNHYRKVIYCAIPKTGCTSMKALMILSTKTMQQLHPGPSITKAVENLKAIDFHNESYLRSTGLELLRDVSKVANTKLKDYFKFITVRNPFDRLLSAYKDKLVAKDEPMFRRMIGTEVINKIRRQNQNLKPAELNITFEESLKYVVSRVQAGAQLDEHWAPIISLINPCLVQFNYIAKLETISDDAPTLLQHLFEKDSPQLWKRNSSPRSRDKSYYNTIDQAIKYKLRQIYLDDFRLFGYNPDTIF